MIFKLFSALAFPWVLVSCTTIDDSIKNTDQLNHTHRQITFDTASGLPVTAWLPIPKKPANIIRIYIEGDGRAWARRNRMSSDPTPGKRLVHGLMLKDTTVDTAYIARPCQFKQNSNCSPPLWTFHRYNETSVQSINEIVQKIKDQFHYQSIELVGFSGGATIALLLSVRRNDVTSVRTVAGNLDPAFTNTIHSVTPMPTALNPSHYARQLQNIPQWHFIGEGDRIIKPSVYHHYASYFAQKQCINYTLVKNATHNDGWIEQWSNLLNLKPQCNTQ